MARYLFVTGKLAAQSLHDCLKEIPDLEYETAILPISVAALMDTAFVAKHLAETRGCSLVVVPGLCRGNLELISDRTGIDAVRGPKSLKDIPAFLGAARIDNSYGEYRSKIVAEIVDAYRMSLKEIVARASYYRSSGADIIDLGGPVEGAFPAIENTVAALKEAGFKVSFDSFNVEDIVRADRAGVDLLLSINSRNMAAVRHLRSKVVVIPDFEEGVESLERNITQLESWRIPYVIDPVLKPIGFGFAASLSDFSEVRRRHPRSEMLMGVGNITELTDADTAGINAVLAGVAAELRIDYLLTTEVICWAKGCVRELDLARRLMHYAAEKRVLPKHLHDGLITIKDPPFEPYSERELRDMQAKIRDRNFRIFADREFIYVFNNRVFVKDTDILSIFKRLGVEDASEAYYLGVELQKALLAVKLGKRYVQEEDLRWGYLSEEASRRQER